MVITLTKRANENIKEFIDNARYGTKNTAKKYMESVISNIDTLCIFPRKGIILFIQNGIEIRQLIVKKHRVIYSILNDEEILVMAVLHCRMNVNEYLQKLKEFM